MRKTKVMIGSLVATVLLMATITAAAADTQSGRYLFRFLNRGSAVSRWGLPHLASVLDQHRCDAIAQRVAQAAAEQLERGAFLAMQLPRPTGSGGVFMVMDVAEPIPGAPYTAEDFAAANIRLLTPREAIFSALTDDVCMVGGLIEAFEPRLSGSQELVEHLLAKNYNLLIVEPELELFFHGPSYNLIVLGTAGLTQEVPSLRNADGSWRSIQSIMEETGCATKPPQPEAQLAAWEYRVMAVGELFEHSSRLGIGLANVGIEQVLNRYGAEGWELMMQLEDLLIFKRPAQ